jgi:tetratricopeptide (TPR) repeat protein
VARAVETRLLRDARPVGIVVRCASWAAVVGLALLLPRCAAAQLPEAEDAFNRGDFRAARALYDSALVLDSLNPRALFRLATLDSWDGKLKRSLARFAILRRIEPHDPEEMVAHARVLSWSGQLKWAAALYDSVLAIDSTRTDAIAGRIRMVAWGGDLNRAERMWREALARHPDDPEVLVGLGQTLEWQGEPDLAELYVARARQLAPSDREVNDLLSQVRAERRPLLKVTSDAANDIEHNSYVAFGGNITALLRPSLQGALRTTWRANSDITADTLHRTSRSSGADAWLVRSFLPRVTLRAGGGVRVLTPNTGASRSFATVQLGVGVHPKNFLSIGANYSRYPFDETRVLVDSGFVWDELGVDIDASPTANLDFSGGWNEAWLSDGNHRRIVNAAAMMGVVHGLRMGVYGRSWAFRTGNPGRGYFAPDRFLLGEGRVVFLLRTPGWWTRTIAGLGAQQVGKDAPTQFEWHADASVGHSWRSVDEVSLVATYTNSAQAQSGSLLTPTAAKYRYWSAGLRYQIGF